MGDQERYLDQARRAVLAFLRSYSVKIALPGHEFDLASGGKSRLYVDAKRTTLHRKMHHPLAALLRAEIAPFGYVDAVAGVVLGGSHLASVVASSSAARDEVLYDVLCVRREAKDHGTRQAVEAPWSPRLGERVVVLEDVLSTGASVTAAIEALRDACFHVVGAVTLLDRRLPGQRAPEVAGVPLRAVYVLEDLELHPEIACTQTTEAERFDERFPEGVNVQTQRDRP